MNFLKFKEAPANTGLIASPWEPKRKFLFIRVSAFICGLFLKRKLLNNRGEGLLFNIGWRLLFKMFLLT